jgi:hypothetical protein
MARQSSARWTSVGFDRADEDRVIDGLKERFGAAVVADRWFDDDYLRGRRKETAGVYSRLSDRRTEACVIALGAPAWRPLYAPDKAGTIRLSNPCEPLVHYLR